MLTITIPYSTLFNEADNSFIYVREQTLTLEHSLISISKWESIFCKPFMSKEKKTTEEVIEYIKCMTLNKNVDPNCYLVIPEKEVLRIRDYIDAPMTATTFSKKEGEAPSREIVTSELIYYWMIASQIPLECEKWHINRLLTLIKVCSIKNAPKKKMSKSEIMKSNASLNAARRAAMNSKG